MGNLFFRFNGTVYEIYPQSETPHLTQIGHLQVDFYSNTDYSPFLLPEKVIWYSVYYDRVVFGVWDYRRNHSISFSAHVDEATQFNIEVYFIFSKALKLASNSFVDR
jgi:hypothetical protein